MFADKPTGSRRKPSLSQSTGSESDGVDSDKPLLQLERETAAVCYRPGGKKQRNGKKVPKVQS